MISKGRFVLLLMENAGCHPTDIIGKYSNINLEATTPALGNHLEFQTVLLQLAHALFKPSKIEECTTTSGVKSLNFSCYQVDCSDSN